MRQAPAAVLLPAVVAIGLALADPALAQQTREELLAAEQEQKATELHPYVPTPAERRIEAVEKMLNSPRSLYPFIGSVFRGSLLAVGPGFRTRFASTGTFDVHGAWSLKNYKLAAAALTLPSAADGRLTADLHASWVDAPKVAFYGPGPASRPDDNSSFLFRSTTAGFSAAIRPMRLLNAGGGLDYLRIVTGPGTAGASIEQVFDDREATGLGAQPTYARGHLFAEIDWRESAGYTRNGGRYRLDWYDYRQSNDGGFGFRRFDAELDQFVPLLRENWVLAFRGLASVTNTDAGDAVPYFLMPDLGGSSQLRGYPSWRFRDRNRMLVTGEYRWTAGEFVDMAIFVDAGKVTPHKRDLDFRGLNTSYGLGVRFHMAAASVLRVELARTRHEGFAVVFGFGPVF